jgi:hypothetical protein
MPIAILVVLICSKIFRTLNIKQAIEWIRIILILAGILSIINLLYYAIVEKDNTFPDRLSGPYAFSYLFMMLSGTLVPLILLYKKAGRNIWILFIVSLMLNVGNIIESVIILISSFHRDHGMFYRPIRFGTISSGLLLGAAIIFLQFCIQKYNAPRTQQRV